ncbi:unnamed protein product [Bemisia tabaci]|uniref:Tr-type G domain-containing protein n=1 Tax=Bemisia tabaci TaxID=7038 RepID=A0A9P0F7N8_BEMTA|nr:unnamed protein product [Bemisia tabaci]
MLFRQIFKAYNVSWSMYKTPTIYFAFRYAATKSKFDIKHIRNIGVLAHIDAGKTTTTERMLFYSGKIRAMGEVHHGNTVTDYLEQERKRGITITSAAVTFPWSDHQINLVDTPGHIDFTTEVEQSLAVMDGGVVVLDSSSGVEAQTLTVWRQAQNYKIPCIVFANKMDRADANLKLCLQGLIQKLEVTPLLLQIPVRVKDKLSGLIDIIDMKEFKFIGEQGEDVMEKQLTEVDGVAWESAKEARNRLTSALADIDDNIADFVITSDSLDGISSKELTEAVRRVTIQRKAVPVLCGSAYKNVGVQKLMDAVVQYLPSPLDRHDADILNLFGHNLYARVFKIMHDKMKGPITFFRIYSGKLEKNQKIFNLRAESSEQIKNVMIAYADDYEEVNTVTAGNVAAVTGLKDTKSGDYISSSQNCVRDLSATLAKKKRISEKEAYQLLGGDVIIPDPVFFCTIEAPSLSVQNAFELALENLKREDPGLRVTTDPDTGQTILGGMGELHLEIVKDRIRSDYKIEADVGPLQIAYRESVVGRAKITHESKVAVGKYANNVSVTLSVEPAPPDNKDLLKLDRSSQELASKMSTLTQQHLKAMKRGIESSMFHGPKVGCPVMNAKFTLNWFETHRSTPESVVASATAQCVQKVLAEAGTSLLEPIMTVEVMAPNTISPKVMAELSKRRGQILNISERKGTMTITANVALSQLLGFSRELRISTSGTASFTMEFLAFLPVDPTLEGEAIKNITGFYP